MTNRLLWVVSLLLVVCGCATLSEQPETPAGVGPENQISHAETENVLPNSGVKLSAALEVDYKQFPSATLDAKEIRKVQTLLKTVGFDPGRIDGVFGPKTKVALLRLRSSCSGLSDLLQEVDLEKIVPAIETSAAHRNDAARTMPSKEETRIIQVRLKDAGFDPGTVDGISGPNTRGAVARFRSGCGAVKTMRPALLEATAATERGDISGASMARGDKMSVASPGVGAGSSQSGSLTSAATKNSSARGARRLY